MTENQFDIIILGSGLSGLLCGYILSREGMKVCILEKEERPGGALQSFERKGIEFNTGLHYLGAMEEGQILHRYFRYFGLADKIRLQRMDINKFDVIAFDNGDFPLAQGFDNFTEQLLPYFPEEKHSLQSYIATLQDIARSSPLYNLEMPEGDLLEDHYRSPSAYQYLEALQQSALLGRQSTVGSNVIAHGAKQPQSACQIGNREPGTEHQVRLSSILAGNNFLYAGSKGKTPLYIPALINHSFISSAWKMVGGSQQIIDLLISSIQQYGGQLITRCKVTSITFRDPGFTVHSETMNPMICTQVISSIHPAVTLGLLAPHIFRKAYESRIRNLANTTGVFTVYAVLKDNSFENFNHNYYYHSSQEVWHEPGKSAWAEGYLMYTPAYEEKGNFAKSMVIMTYMDYRDVQKWENSETGKRDESYYRFKDVMADRLLALVEKRIPGIREKISFMETSTPLTWRDYTGTPGGSMYGIQKDFNDPSGTSVLPVTRVPGFYFTGQNTNIHGVLGVTIGSVMTCSSILGNKYLLKKISDG
jgi:all-trans-retinol 13,14-reductase